MSVVGLTDTHCHLNHDQFDDDREQVIERARNAGVERLLVIGYDLASSRFALELACSHDAIQAVVGIHPESASEWTPECSDELRSLARENRDRVVGWGEIGLDFYWDSVPRDTQVAVFEQQLDAAAELELPVVIHCRDAYDDVVEILERRSFRRAVLHCFTGTLAQAQRAAELGLYLGVGGIATYKRSDDLRAAIATLPVDRVLIETDAPYLAPQRWRGKRNEPAYVVAAAELLAELWKLSVHEVAAVTSVNADRLFGRMK